MYCSLDNLFCFHIIFYFRATPSRLFIPSLCLRVTSWELGNRVLNPDLPHTGLAYIELSFPQWVNFNCKILNRGILTLDHILTPAPIWSWYFIVFNLQVTWQITLYPFLLSFPKPITLKYFSLSICIAYRLFLDVFHFSEWVSIFWGLVPVTLLLNVYKWLSLVLRPLRREHVVWE